MEKEDRVNLVRYRIDRAIETLAEIDNLKKLGYYNTAINRMYYACFYAANALLVANGIEVKSHASVRNSLSSHFVKEGILPKECGKFYSLIFSKRTSGDYEDFFTHDISSVEMLLPQTEKFIGLVKCLVGKWLDEQ